MKLRVDDLARRAGTTVRNVRAYQERGLLPPPVREGRVAYYSENHVARLRTISALLERGFSQNNIAELFAGWETGRELGDLLGLEAIVTSPFSEEEPADVSLAELVALYGTSDPAVVTRAVSAGLIEPPSPDGRVRVPSMRLLRAGAELHAAGIPLDALFEEIQELREDVARIAQRFVTLALTHVLAPRVAKQASLPALAGVVRKIRPLAKRVVDAELARALEDHVRAAFGEQIASVGSSRERPRRGRAPGRAARARRRSA